MCRAVSEDHAYDTIEFNEAGEKSKKSYLNIFKSN